MRISDANAEQDNHLISKMTDSLWDMECNLVITYVRDWDEIV